MPPYVIAFHGRPGRPGILRRDMGDPPWVDQYFAGHDIDAAANEIDRHCRVILVGYSFGGDLIARLTHRCSNVVGAVLYESPLLEPMLPRGHFPVCMVWNDRGRRHWPASQRSCLAWDLPERIFVPMNGRGGHVRMTWRWPFVGHAWDQSLNGQVETFIQFCRLGDIASVGVHVHGLAKSEAK